MFVVTALLLGLLALALFVAARELVGFRPQPEWQDVGKLKERFSNPMPPLPHPRVAGRRERVRFCLDLRREFRSAWLLCRFLAPITGDAQYVGQLLAAKARFNLTLLVALGSAALGARQICENATERLSEISAAMRAAAVHVLGDAELARSFSAV